MKKSPLQFINIFLTIILGLLFIINIAVRLKNKEFNKILWHAEIQSSVEDTSTENTNLIKIVDATLYNNFSQSSWSLDYESLQETSGISNSVNKRSTHFKTWDKELLPDSLNLKYYSVDERKFYIISTRLPDEKIESLSKEETNTPILLIEIFPKGKIVLKINTIEAKFKSPKIIKTFTAKETTGNLEMLLYKKSLGSEYNNYKDIENITDFSDLLQHQQKWFVQIQKEEKDHLTSIYAYSFAEDKIEISENYDFAKTRGIPRQFYIDWENDEKHSATFYFNPNEILKAYRKLNEIEPSRQIKFTFKLNNEYIQCEISNQKTSIPLKNLYP